MAEQDCLAQVHACAMRVANLLPNGIPDPGDDNLYVSDALSVMTVTPVYADGDEIEEKNACGVVKVNRRGADTFKRLDVAISLVTPDPFLSALFSGGDLLEAAGKVGFAAPPIGPITGNGVSIELWAERVTDDGDLDPDNPYAWWVYPKIKNLRLGEFAHQNGAILPAYTGQGHENANWFDGPENDWPAASDRVFQWFPTDTIPTPTCELQTLAAS